MDVSLTEKRKIALRMFAQLFSGEILDAPISGPQLAVAEILSASREDAEKQNFNETKRILDRAGESLQKIQEEINSRM